MKHMHAALLTKIGEETSLKFSSVAIPKHGKDEALVRIMYCGVNHLDLLIKQGKRIGPKRFPHVLGSEVVGIIESLSSGAKGLKTGDTVAVYPWTFCGKCRFCISGNENICETGGTMGRTTWGGYAQYIVVPIRNLIKLPKNLSVASVCAVTLAGTTAHHLIDRANIRSKSVVLVTGATGGVGTAVIQLLKHRSCTIIASTSHKKKIFLLKKLGVSLIVPTDRLVETIKNVYPQGVPYVIDIMGGSVWSSATEVVAKN